MSLDQVIATRVYSTRLVTALLPRNLSWDEAMIHDPTGRVALDRLLFPGSSKDVPCDLQFLQMRVWNGPRIWPTHVLMGMLPLTGAYRNCGTVCCTAHR